MENQELKNSIKEFFVKINEDKFTKVKYVTSKNSFKLNYDGLLCSVEYRRKEDLDKIYLIFNHLSSNDTLDMRNSKLYVIINDDKTIELLNSQVLKSKEIVSGIYTSSCQIEVEVSDFISLVNANKLEYSFRCESGSVDGLISKNSSVILKGFYNSVFDDEFELEILYKYISNQKAEPNIWDINKLKVFGSTSEVPIIIHGKIALDRIKNGSIFEKWSSDKMNFDGEILFGFAPLQKAVVAIFTEKGVYSNGNVNYVSYESQPDFTLNSSLLSYSIKDNKSGLEFNFSKNAALSKEKCQIIIDYINAQIQKYS